MVAGDSLQRTASVARKEVLHIVRDRTTLFFALFIPVLQLVMIGFAIDTNVRHVRTLVLDQARTQDSRDFLRAFVNSEDIKVLGEVYSDDELTEGIVAGEAKVGIKIPEDFSRCLEAGRTAQVLILVDGSDSSVTAEIVNLSNAIAMRQSLNRVMAVSESLPIEARPRVLFNPDTRSPNFFIPGLMIILCQMMSVMLAATAIVREKERGTLEQLYMTPVRPGELIIGKITPYLGLTMLEFTAIAFLMRTLFRVPIRGDFLTLLGMALPFALAMLGLGLGISTRANTRDAAMQMAMGTIMPSIFLSGYIFPIDSMPLFFRIIANAIPTTWMIDASRGVILRGAGWTELRQHALILWCMAVVLVLVSSLRFHKQVS